MERTCDRCSTPIGVGTGQAPFTWRVETPRPTNAPIPGTIRSTVFHFCVTCYEQVQNNRAVVTAVNGL